MESLLDIHTHIESIFSTNPEIIKVLKEKASPAAKCWEKANAEDFLKHIKKNNLDTLYTTFQNPEAMIELREKNNTGCKIRGMYYIKNILCPPEKKIRQLYQKGLVSAIKLHPIMDYYELSSEKLHKVLSLAEELKVPILFHTDDRREFMELTSPDRVENLVKQNPGINFIIGHGGNYAHPRIYGSHPSVRKYWQGSGAPYSRFDLIARALRTSWLYKNAFYDLTICTNRIKAGIIVDFLMHHPETANKILVGSDFPLGSARTQSQVKALEKAGLPDNLLKIIIKNRPFEKADEKPLAFLFFIFVILFRTCQRKNQKFII